MERKATAATGINWPQMNDKGRKWKKAKQNSMIVQRSTDKTPFLSSDAKHTRMRGSTNVEQWIKATLRTDITVDRTLLCVHIDERILSPLICTPHLIHSTSDVYLSQTNNQLALHLFTFYCSIRTICLSLWYWLFPTQKFFFVKIL